MRLNIAKQPVWAEQNSSTVEEVAVGDMIRCPRNPRKLKKEEIERAVPFVKRYMDNIMPVMIGATNEILVGEAFVEAARMARIEKLRVVRQGCLDENEQLLFSIAANKVLEAGYWDGDMMGAALREFEKNIKDFSHDLIAFPAGALDKLVGSSTSCAGADQLPVTTDLSQVSRAGRVWVAGRHRVMCGDATNAAALAILMAGQTAAAASLDPPFGCAVDGFVATKGKHRDFVQASGEMSDNELLDFFRQLCRTLGTALRPGALVYLFIDWRSLHLLLQAGQEVFGKLINLCVWSKDRGGMGSFYRSQHELVLVFRQPGAQHRNNIQLGKHGVNRTNVWAYPCAASSRKGREGDLLKSHPTPKMVEMIADAMLDCTVRGEIVVDTFLGSGTSLIAAERTGRICFGMDLDPLYVDLSIRRWQTWTGEKAVDCETGETFGDLAERSGEEGEGDE